MRTAQDGDPRRTLLLTLLRAGLARVDGRRCVREALSAAGTGEGRVWVAAVGKAAAAMAHGAHDALGTAIEHTLLITRDLTPDAAQLSSSGGAVEIVLGAHPVPDERSLEAGERLLAWTEALPRDASPLFLISGGASSLAEVLVPGATLAELQALTREAFVAGLAIGELNRRRSRLSQIKGGGLARRLRGRTARALFVSDVPGDDPDVIGSGILGASPGVPDRI